MRIIDLSSDVCSSDLGSGTIGASGSAAWSGDRDCAGHDLGLLVHRRVGDGRARDKIVDAVNLHDQSDDLGQDGRCADFQALQVGDRKSVVEGKSVSVRVDLGGRRILKKKTNKK